DAVIAAGASNATLMGGGDGVVMVTTNIPIATMSAEDLANTLGAPAGASLAADIAAVKSQTAAIEADTQDLQTQIGTDGAGLTAIPWNSAWDAEVQSECTDALNAYDPPTNAEMTARTLAAASYATAANQTTMDGKLDIIDGIVDAILVDT